MTSNPRYPGRRATGKPLADDDTAKHGARSGHMGPGEAGGGYAHQHFDVDRTGGAYGGNESSGGSFAEPFVGKRVLKGQQHMAGTYGNEVYGRIGDRDGRVPLDPSQRHIPSGANTSDGGARPMREGQNAQIAGALPSETPIGRGSENERTAPGISTDKRSDDTRD